MQKDTPATGTLSALRNPRRPLEGDCVGHRALVPSSSGTNFVCMAHSGAHIKPLGNEAEKVLQGLSACFLYLRIHVLAVVQVSPSEACEPDTSRRWIHATRPRRAQPKRRRELEAVQARLGEQRGGTPPLQLLVLPLPPQLLGRPPERRRPRRPALPSNFARTKEAGSRRQSPAPARGVRPASSRRWRPLFLLRHSSGRRLRPRFGLRDSRGRQRAPAPTLPGARHAPPPPWERRAAEVTQRSGRSSFESVPG